jgi:hypothetical protein
MWAAQSGRSFGPIIVGTKDSIDITDTHRKSTLTRFVRPSHAPRN